MTAQTTVERLAELGFSQYEARAYVGLVAQEAMTGYALANRTQIPQPKVYEMLRRLEDKRAVVRIGSDPARYVAVPPEQFVASLADDYRRRLDDVRTGLGELGNDAPHDELRVLESPRSWPSIRARATTLLDQAVRHVYVSGHEEQLRELAVALEAADARGVRCDVLYFGHSTLTLPGGRVVEHSSTNGVVYRHHQARHLALVVDTSHALWALAPEGDEWDAMVADDALFASVVKGYVRHDVYVQQIFADFTADLVGRYGPSLEGLIDAATSGPSSTAGTVASGGRRAVARKSRAKGSRTA